jgi:predicted  nucleic acid-binding Zn-ribbon protein
MKKLIKMYSIVMYNRDLTAEMTRMKSQMVVLEESLASCDSQRVSLQYQMNDLEAEVEALREAVQKNRVRRSDVNMSELQTLKVSEEGECFK